MKVAAMCDTTHNPFNETHWVSCLRENLTSSSYGKGLETGRAMTQVPRQSFTRQDAFALTKRVLDLAYLWTGSPNAVQLQIYATLMFYAVLLTICQQVAEALGEPLERSSVEMVFRSFYHYSRAVQHGEWDELVPFLVAHVKLLGIVKRWRKHHRERQQLESIIWGDP